MLFPGKRQREDSNGGDSKRHAPETKRNSIFFEK